AQTWAEAVQACDRSGAAPFEGVRELFVTVGGPPALCGSSGRWTAGAVASLPPGAAAQALVSQYGPEVYEWARVVPLEGPGRRYQAVLAPLGESWKVIGIFD
ncbi:MAG: hypothetical protein ACRD0M_07040, partial [Acidimicrobiales bacterium]